MSSIQSSSFAGSPFDLVSPEMISKILGYCAGNLTIRSVCHGMRNIHDKIALDTFWTKFEKESKHDSCLNTLMSEIEKDKSLNAFEKFKQVNQKCGIALKGELLITVEDFQVWRRNRIIEVILSYTPQAENLEIYE